MTNNKMLNENYRKSCLNQIKRRLNDLLNKFLDDENIESNYKSRVIDIPRISRLFLNKDKINGCRGRI